MVEITEIIRPLAQGFTQPYLCRGADGIQYVVKGNDATREGLINEWVCANIGIKFGLPIPVPVIASVPTMFTEYSEYPNLSIGECFGSTYISGLSEVIYSQLDQLDRETLLDLYVFDYWIKNGDRSLTELGGNPNFFVDVKQQSAVVIDHNLAFDNQFSINTHKQSHVSSKFWNSDQTRMFDFPVYECKLKHGLSCFDQCIEQIPDIWFHDLEHKAGVVNRLKLTLSAYEQADFWEGLK